MLPYPRVAALLTTVWFALGGCATDRLSSLSHSVCRLPGEDRDAGFARARAAVMALGFQIDRADPATGLITTKPLTVEAHEERGSPDVPWSAPRAFRRIAEVRFRAVDDVLRVYCKIEVQQQMTETHRILWQDLAATDIPSETAIDRGAASTAAQDDVWQVVRRDKAAERRILHALVKPRTAP